MDLVLARLAGARPPTVEALRAALHRQDWLKPEADRGVWTRSFDMTGGHIRLLTKGPEEPWYDVPCLQARLAPDADFRVLGPRIVPLAGALSLGIATTGSKGALWWPAPEPEAVSEHALDRALAVSQACEGREAWPLLGFALAGPECLELAESHPAMAFLLANTVRVDGRHRGEMRPAERMAFLRELARRPRRAILAALDLPAPRRWFACSERSRRRASTSGRYGCCATCPSCPTQPRHSATSHVSTAGFSASRCGRSSGPTSGPSSSTRPRRRTATASCSSSSATRSRWRRPYGRLGEVGILPSMAALARTHDRLREDYEARPQRNLNALRGREEAAQAEQQRRPAPARPPVPPAPAPIPRPLAEGPAVLPIRPHATVRRPRRIFAQPPPPPAGVIRLRTQADLTAEGREMDHCAATYGRSVERGAYLIYRVLRPERATLALRWSAAEASGRSTRSAASPTGPFGPRPGSSCATGS